jgi:phosphatidate cytidylyltransferase
VADARPAARPSTAPRVSPLALRLLSALAGVPLLIGLTLVGGLPYVIAATLGAVRAMYEMLRMLRRAGYRPIDPLGYALVAALVLSAWLDRSHAEAALMAVGVAAGLVWLLGRVDDPGAIVDWALTVAPALYVGLLLGFLVPLRDAPDGLGAFWVLAVLVATWACDSAAYFVGGAWGRHKLAPRISPAKSVEGAVAGVVGAALVAGFLFAPVFAAVLAAATAAGLPVPALPPFPSAARLVGLGVVVGLCAILGDLIESFVKRQCGAKDSGALIPGHGGVLDRMDSVMLAVVGAYLYVLATA